MKYKKEFALFGVALVFAFAVFFKNKDASNEALTISFAPAKAERNLAASERESPFESQKGRQIASIVTEKKGVFFDEKLHPLCYFKTLSKQNVPLQNIKKLIWHLGASTPQGSDKIFVMAINEESCPARNYRIVRAAYHQDSGWITEKDIDCTNTNAEEQFAYGVNIQGEIESVEAQKNALNIAINGDGFFHLKCKNGNYLDRSGAFFRESSGHLKNDLGCYVLDREENPIQILEDGSQQMDKRGCFEDGICLKIVSFEQLESLKGFKVDSALGMVKVSAREKLAAMSAPEIVNNALEDQKYSLLVKDSQHRESEEWMLPPTELNCESVQGGKQKGPSAH